LLQAERQERQEIIDEKQSRALLKNTLDPLLSQLTKASEADSGTQTKTKRRVEKTELQRAASMISSGGA
jgi:hypothetical protein